MKGYKKYDIKLFKYCPQDLGFTLIEGVISFIILAFFVTLGGRLINSTSNGISSADLRSKVDSVFALRIEEIRHCAFFYLLDSSLLIQGDSCSEDSYDMTEVIAYDMATLTPLCNSNSLGTSFSNYLTAEGLGGSFNLQDYDADSVSETIQTTLTPNGNRLNVTLSSSSTSLSISTTVVPQAQGMCP